MRKHKRPTDPLERSIYSRELGLRRMQQLLDRVRDEAERDIEAIKLRIDEKRILLDALKQGKLRKR